MAVWKFDSKPQIVGKIQMAERAIGSVKVQQ